MDHLAYYQCVAVNQPLGTFYFCTISASKILPLVSIERRGLTPDEQKNIQRALDTKRQLEISKYVREPDATFPTSVILSADSEYVHIIQSNGALYLVIGTEIEPRPVTEQDTSILMEDGVLAFVEDSIVRIFKPIPSGEKIALVIDGQHRMEGLRAAGAERDGTELSEFEIPLIFMFDLSPELMARIFVTINANQRKVDPSLISDLFGLSSRRSPMRTCHVIAATLNSESGGPFSNGLKMLGRRQNTTEFLSQGSFCKYLLKLISNTPDEDERRLQKNEPLIPDTRAPLREYFRSTDDDVILRITRNYFTAVMNAYPTAWSNNPAEYLIRKTVGFACLIKLLIKILPTALELGDASKEAFDRIFNKIKLTFPEDEWGAGKFSSSDADASKVASRLFQIVAPELEKLIRPPEEEKSL